VPYLDGFPLGEDVAPSPGREFSRKVKQQLLIQPRATLDGQDLEREESNSSVSVFGAVFVEPEASTTAYFTQGRQKSPPKLDGKRYDDRPSKPQQF